MSSKTTCPGPAFHGYVETTGNALRIVYAAIEDVVPRTSRRLNDTERRTMIKSGAVFVFSVAESGIKRWTDGMLWSPSRIQGNFLVYRELSEKGYTRNSPLWYCDVLTHGQQAGSSLPNDIGTIKNNGLMKKTITITHNGTDFHLISYYKKEDISCGRLQKPTTSHQIMALHLPARMFQLEKLRSPPKIEIGPDGIERIE
ncbi:Gti1/Pac2 family-domain-containing protein [Pterulicium gracile]|uniref:Gti1/Pac2 family-domain-containing protein n=1 Tax=Pterulicium gracile TaxID=1884261 RepID=A0A5C3QAW1_9AGAR|nr:Gti1/Pac2 family-domain-containing protein [Pterula gracilis]